MHIGEFSGDFASVPYASNLLGAFCAQPDFQKGPPSNDILTFISRVDDTDPNSDQFDEDNTDASWGHHQFMAGGLTVTKVLTSWSDIGSVETACRLLATTIRTCKVARHICFQRRIMASSYLSDAYLSNIVERLWELWKTAGGVSFFYYNLICSHPCHTSLNRRARKERA